MWTTGRAVRDAHQAVTRLTTACRDLGAPAASARRTRREAPVNEVSRARGPGAPSASAQDALRAAEAASREAVAAHARAVERPAQLHRT